jgi:hypothetical protein
MAAAVAQVAEVRMVTGSTMAKVEVAAGMARNTGHGT